MFSWEMARRLRKRDRTHRPAVFVAEALERRVLLSAVSWTGAAGDSQWTTPGNWSTDVVPGAGDDVTFGDSASPTIQINSGAQSINSLTSSDPISIGTGATLAIGTTATISGTLTLNGGTLRGAVVNESGGTALLIGGSGVIDGLTVNGGIDMTRQAGAKLIVYNGLVLNGALSLGNNAGSASGQVLFGDSTHAAGTLGGTGTVVFGASANNSITDHSSLTGAAGTFTIGPNITIHGQNGSILADSTNGNLFNQGNINADTAPGTILVGNTNASVTNAGTIQVNNGAALTITGLQNQTGASISATNSTLTLNVLNDAGTITVTSSTVNLVGNVSQSALGTFNRTGGTVNMDGAFQGDLNLNASTGSWNIAGTLTGGTVNTSDGATYGFTSNGDLVADETFNGDLNLTLQSNAFLIVLGYLKIAGTLRLGNAAATNPTNAIIQLGTALQSFSPGSGLGNTPPGYQVGDTTLTATNIVFGTSSSNAIVNASLAFISKPGPNDPPALASYTPVAGGSPVYVGGGNITVNAAIQAGSGSIWNEFAGSTVTVNGSVAVSGTGSSFAIGGSQILGVEHDVFANNAPIQVTDGGAISLADLVNASSISVNSGALTLLGTLQNNSSITATNAAVFLGGTFFQSQLGNFTRPGSTIELTGTLEGGLTLDASTGSWVLQGGVIDGGVVSESGGAELAFTSGSLNNGVVFDGDMDLAGQYVFAQAGGYVIVRGGLTLNGTMYLGNLSATAFGVVEFGDATHPPSSLEGNATVVFGDSTGGNRLQDTWAGPGAQTFTIGPNVTLRGMSGSVQQASGETLVLQGAVSADISGGTIQLGTSGNVINQGSIAAINGGGVSGVNLTNAPGKSININAGTLSLSGTWSNLGNITASNSTVNLGGTFPRSTLGNFVRTGGTVNLTGTLTGGIVLDANLGSWVLLHGTVLGGTLNTINGSALVLSTFGGTFNGVTVNGTIDARQQQASTATVLGGLVLNGTMYLGSATNSNAATVFFTNAGNTAASLTGNATVILGDQPNGNFLRDNAGGTFTIGPGITVRGNNGGVASSGTVVNQGRIYADTPGGVIQLGNVTFINQGAVQATAGTILTLGTFEIDGQGTIGGNWQADWTFGGNVAGASTGYAGSDPLGTITVSGPSSPASPQLLEVMSRDFGNTSAGFQNNFVYGTLVIAADVKLVDQSPNAPGSGDALYVDQLAVSSFDQLNLNGIHVYARAVSIGGAASVVNGAITQLPDGGAINLNQAYPGSVSPAGNVDNWTFFGRSGQVVTVYANPGGGTAPTPIGGTLGFAGVSLLDPSGRVLASGSSTASGAAVSLAQVALPADGVYTVSVSAAASRPGDTGNYVVAAFDVTPRIAPLNPGQNTFGSIQTPFDVQQWTFSALAGQQIQFLLLNETSAGLAYTLTGPNGYVGFSNLSGNSTLLNLPSDGGYTLSAQGSNGAIGNYSFIVNETTQTNIPLNGSINGSVSGTGQPQLFTIAVPSVQSLNVSVNDLNQVDSNELYLRFGAPPTRQTFDYRYASAGSADQSILVPHAAAGTWYVLLYSAYAPAPSTFTLSDTGSGLQVVTSIPAALGNAAPETLSIAGAGFEPGTTVSLVGQGNGQSFPISQSVVSYTQIYATFAAGLPAGTYSIQVTQGGFTSVLNNAFTATNGGAAHFQTGLRVPSALGRHEAATVYISYANVGTVAMPAPMLLLASTNPAQQPLFTLDPTKITGGLATSTLPEGYTTTVQILASGQIPGVLLPGESITVPVYYSGLLQPWNGSLTSLPLNLGEIDASNTTTVDWSSLKASLQPVGVPAAGWNQIFSNLTAQLGNTWGSFVTALDNNAAYLGGLGENVTDIDKLWNFMYLQANDALGPMEHLQTVFDASLPLPNGGTLSFWRNYHLPISGRYASGMLGNGWSVPYQSSLVFNPDNSIILNTVGEESKLFEPNGHGGFFPSDDGSTYDGFDTITSPDGESDTYGSAGQLVYHSDAAGNRINFSYDSSGRLSALTASTGQSIALAYNATGLLGTLTTSAGDVTIYQYDASNQFLTAVQSYDGTTRYGYDTTNNELTSIQAPDGSVTTLGYDSFGRLLSLASPLSSMTLSYPLPGQISGTDALNNTASQFYNEDGLIGKTIDQLGNPTYMTYDPYGDLQTITDATGDTYKYSYNLSGEVTSVDDPLGYATAFAYDALGRMTSITDANNNTISYAYDPAGSLQSINYPDGTQQSFAFSASGEPESITQRNGQAISLAYDANGNVTKETFADGSHYDYTYNAFGNLLTATDSTGTTTFTYNSLGELTSVAYPSGQSLTYTYDSLGRRTGIVDQSGYTTSYAYDSLGRPSKVLDGSGNPIAVYTYDAMSRVIRQDNGNGTHTTYDYDAAGNILHVINFAPGGAINSRFDYTYNQLNQISAMSTLDGTWGYSYDSAGQLVRAIFTSTNPGISNQDLAYNYDPVGNRTSTIINGVTTTYVPNADNQYTSIGGVNQLYDANGNLIYDGTSTYTYNALNQLTATQSAGGNSQFTYNALGQQISATVNGQTTQYLNDPTGFGRVMAEYNGSGQLIAHFNLGLGLLSQTTEGGANYTYDGDQLGSIVGVSDSTGSYVDSYSYLPFGQTLASSGSVANPFQFVGKLGVRTMLSNLLLMGARDYVPSAGAFLTTDPLQATAGTTTFYGYALNQPLQVVDPSGLKSLTWRYNPPAQAPMPGVSADGGPGALSSIAGTAGGLLSELGEAKEAAETIGGPVYDTTVDVLKDIVIKHEVPSLDEIADSFTDNVFDKLNVGPFQIGTIEKTLLQPDFALNVVNGINGIRRAHLCGTINGYEAAALVAIGMASAGCEGAPGVVAPRAPAGAGVTANSAVVGSVDPNAKFGPAGYGPSGFVAGGSLLPYRIDFENAPTATAPAQQVNITDQLSSNLNWSTFRLTEIGWGDTVITVPADTQQYQTDVPMTYNGQTFDVLVQAALNLGTGVLSVVFMSIDPVTNLPPDVLTGFLPPDDGTGRGDGHVSYTILPIPNLVTGTPITNIALVSFDGQPQIATDQVNDEDPTEGVDPSKQALVTIDSGAPTSVVAALPATTSTPSFTVSWSGQDDTGGSGIASYNVYVSTDGGPFALWLDNQTQTSSIYPGQSGHTYAFYSVATDNVGNVQATPGTAQAQTSVPLPMLLSSGFGNGSTLTGVQRSEVRNITLLFNTAVTLASGAVTLGVYSGTDTAGTLSNASAALGTPATSDGGFTWIIPILDNTAFSDSTGSLNDGIYKAIVHSGLVADSSKTALAGGDQSITFHRLFGDINGDKIVNNFDYLKFKASFLSSRGQANYNSDFDFNGDGVINNLDYLRLKARFLKQFVY